MEIYMMKMAFQIYEIKWIIQKKIVLGKLYSYLENNEPPFTGINSRKTTELDVCIQKQKTKTKNTKKPNSNQPNKKLQKQQKEAWLSVFKFYLGG